MSETSTNSFAFHNCASALSAGTSSSVAMGRLRFESDNIVYDDILVVEHAASLHAPELRTEVGRTLEDADAEALVQSAGLKTGNLRNDPGSKSINWFRGPNCTIGTLRFAANSALFIALAKHRSDTELSWKLELAQLVLYEAFRRQKFTGFIPSPQELILNQIDQGIILVDVVRNVLYQNDAAVSVLARSTNIAVQTGELVGRYQTVTQKLEATILAVTTKDEIRTVVLPNGILGHPEVITFVPLLDQPGCVLVCFGRSTDVDPEITKSVLSAFGLTPAECRVALALQRGASVNEIAVQANLKVTTARGYLKRIFLKIGARRQPELVAFIAAKTPGLRIARDRLKERRDR